MRQRKGRRTTTTYEKRLNRPSKSKVAITAGATKHLAQQSNGAVSFDKSADPPAPTSNSQSVAPPAAPAAASPGSSGNTVPINAEINDGSTRAEPNIGVDVKNADEPSAAPASDPQIIATQGHERGDSTGEP